MPLLHETNPPNNQTNSQALNPPSKGLFTLPDSVMKLVPWVPFILEATTGQKIPQLGGTMGEIQQGIQAIQMTQAQIIQSQQNLERRLTSLETNAANQFTNLTHQFNSLRLTHTKERKEIAYNNLPEDQNQDY